MKRTMSGLTVQAMLLTVLTVLTAPTGARAGEAVKGQVFLDKDGDGKRSGGEKGLRDVHVSNGQQVVKTGADGAFTIPAGKPNAPDKRAFVFLIAPEGYQPAGNWYVETPAKGPVHFGLKEFPRGKSRDFCFAHVSDTQVKAKDDQGVPVALEELAVLDIKPAFIVNTGDLVGASASYYPKYKEVMALSKLRVINTKGNHDPNYDSQFGPSTFALDSNGMRFVSWYGSKGFLPNFCKDLPKGVRVAEFVHFPLGVGKYFEKPRPFPRVVLHLSGNNHINKIRQRKDGLLDIETTAYKYRKRDSAPVGYRIIGFKDGKLYTYYRPSGFKRLLAAAMPSEGGVYRPGKLPVQINAYSGTAVPAKVEVALGEGRAAPAGGWVALKKQGVFAWSGEVDAAGRTGAQKLHVRVTTVGGKKWTALRSFTLAAGPAIKAQPGKGSWPQYLHNSGVAKGAQLSPPLQVAWCARAGGVIERVSPVVADGKLVQGVSRDSLEDFHGAVCLDAATGAELWKKKLRSVKASPATDGKTVFLPGNDGTLTALALADGKQLWRGEKLTATRVYQHVYVSPDGSKVYARTGHRAAWNALDPKNGAKGGTVARKGLPQEKLTYPAAVAALASRKRGRKNAFLDEICGSEHKFLGGSVAGFAVVGKTGFAATGSGKVVAFSIPDGKVTWSMDMGTPFIAPPVAVGKTLYLAGYNGYIYALVPRGR